MWVRRRGDGEEREKRREGPIQQEVSGRESLEPVLFCINYAHFHTVAISFPIYRLRYFSKVKLLFTLSPWLQTMCQVSLDPLELHIALCDLPLTTFPHSQTIKLFLH